MKIVLNKSYEIDSNTFAVGKLDRRKFLELEVHNIKRKLYCWNDIDYAILSYIVFHRVNIDRELRFYKKNIAVSYFPNNDIVVIFSKTFYAMLTFTELNQGVLSPKNNKKVNDLCQYSFTNKDVIITYEVNRLRLKINDYIGLVKTISRYRRDNYKSK